MERSGRRSARIIVTIFLFSLFYSQTVPGLAQFSRKLPSSRPRLVVTIIIDPFSIDQLNRYQDKMGKEGFRKLVSQGTFFNNARYDYFFAGSATGISTMISGANPNIHGIVGSNWYEPLHDTQVFCTADEGVTAVGGSFDNGQHSPQHLLTSTLGDEIRLSSRMESKSYSVALHADDAVLAGGHLANAAYWYDNAHGSWMTSTYYMDSLPVWVKSFNEEELPRTYLDKSWTPLLPPEEYTASLPDTSDKADGLQGRTVFPYDLKKISSLGRRHEDLGILMKTPFGNTFTEDFVTNLIINEELGKDDTCDFLAVSFSANREILRTFGPESVEMEDAVLRLDNDLAHLLSFLEKEVGRENMLVVLTASRGVSYDVKQMTRLKIPTGFFNPNQAMTLLSSYLNVIYGERYWVKGYHNHQIYLDHVMIEDAGLNLYAMQDRVADFMLQFSGVSHVMTAHTLNEAGNSSPVFMKIQNGFYPKRSGDVFIVLNPGWQEKNGHAINTGSGFWYDSHVPLVWYGWKIPRKTSSRRIDMTAVAPTISYFLKIPAPNGSEGLLIDELLDTKNK
jgi:hypothetical protein